MHEKNDRERCLLTYFRLVSLSDQNLIMATLAAMSGLTLPEQPHPRHTHLSGKPKRH